MIPRTKALINLKTTVGAMSIHLRMGPYVFRGSYLGDNNCYTTIKSRIRSMKTSKWLVGSTICLALACMFMTGCNEDDLDNPFGTYEDEMDDGTTVIDYNNTELGGAWADIQSGFITTLNGNGTDSVTTANGTPVQTGTWTTSGNQITFTPKGDVPATMTYSLSGDTLTTYDEGEAHVFTR